MKHFVSCTPQACQAHKSMKHFAALAAKYEAPLVSGMKRSLTASCFFALESRQKNGRGERNPALSFANSLFQ